MPYIKQEDRVSLDPLIDALAEDIVKKSSEVGNNAAYAGLLNYVCTRLALKDSETPVRKSPVLAYRHHFRRFPQC